MKQLSTIMAPVFVPPTTYTKADRFFLKYIKDQRDLPFIYLTLRITLILIPLVPYLFTLCNFWQNIFYSSLKRFAINGFKG